MRYFLTSVLAMAVVLSGCDSDQTATDTTSAANTSPQTPMETTDEASESVPDLEGRTVLIAVENGYLPFNYVLAESGEAGGWDYEAWQAICDIVNCEPDFREMAWIGTLDAVADGTVDSAGNGISITPERQETLVFSDPYFSSMQRVYVQVGEDRFDSPQALADSTELVVGAQNDTTNFDEARALVGMDRVRGFENLNTLLEALRTGEIAAIVIDDNAAPMVAGEDSGVMAVVPPLANDRLAFPFANGSDLVEPVNYALDELRDNGALDELASKYFTNQFTITYDQIQLPESDVVPVEEAASLDNGEAVESE